MSLFLELIEPKAPLFAYDYWGALYKYLNTMQKNTMGVNIVTYKYLDLLQWQSNMKISEQ